VVSYDALQTNLAQFRFLIWLLHYQHIFHFFITFNLAKILGEVCRSYKPSLYASDIFFHCSAFSVSWKYSYWHHVLRCLQSSFYISLFQLKTVSFIELLDPDQLRKVPWLMSVYSRVTCLRLSSLHITIRFSPLLQYTDLNYARLWSLTADCHEKAFVLEEVSHL
jgi:hypothetical protein